VATGKLFLKTVVSEMFEENAYIAHLDGMADCLVVDPGFEPQPILDYVSQQGLSVAAILNTHGHADHIAGNASLKEAWPDAPLVIGHGDAPKLTDPMLNLSGQYGMGLVSPAADTLVEAGQVYQAAGFDLEVRETPGHSCGHVVFVWHETSPPLVFGGDVLFQRSVGRTDFPDGSFEDLAESIQTQLFVLPDDSIVLPGHGPATTIGEEKLYNPFVGQAKADD
jgi:glyoxylase-like metal-dependent hydrolase (beta-lactamase superfamily II)